MRGVIKTKALKEPYNRDDGKRYIVTRYFPRWTTPQYTAWLIQLSPSAELLKDYKDRKIDWSVFSKRYIEQMNSDPESITTIMELAQIAKKKTITLLCYENEGENCHRYLLKNLIEEYQRNGV